MLVLLIANDQQPKETDMKNILITFLITSLMFMSVTVYGFTSGKITLPAEPDYLTTLASAKR